MRISDGPVFPRLKEIGQEAKKLLSFLFRDFSYVYHSCHNFIFIHLFPHQTITQESYFVSVSLCLPKRDNSGYYRQSRSVVHLSERVEQACRFLSIGTATQNKLHLQ